jgi:hypothetical protein
VSLTAAFVAHELRIQSRSLRFRVAVGAYVLLGAAPALVVHLRRPGLAFTVGPATYLGEVMTFLPQLTALFAALLALDGITREQQEGAWTTLSLSGISNAGYLLRRWIGLLAVILPWTALPILAAAGIAGFGTGGQGLQVMDPLPFLAAWLLHIAPLAAVVATLSLSLGTIAGGLVGAALLLQAALMGVAFVTGPLLFRLGYALREPFFWLDFRIARLGFHRLAGRYDSAMGRAYPVPSSEAGVDLPSLAEQHLAQSLFLGGLAAAALALAVLFLGRTRPDVRPWRIRPDHPFRTYLRLLVKAWQRGRPDPRPARRDLLACAAALLVAAGAAGLFLARSAEYRSLARQRYEAGMAGGEGTPGSLLPGRWRVAGHLGPHGKVDVRVSAELRNTGAEPIRRAAFQINPELRVTADSPLKQTWDRLEVTLDPPLPPGGRRELRFHVTGRPAELILNIPEFEGGFFPTFRRQLKARFAHDLSELSLSYRFPGLARSRVALHAADLSPVPRYQSWDLQGDTVPEDAFLPAADLEVSLAAEPGLFLADACGGMRSGPSGLSGRLESRCRLAVAEMMVAGGPHRLLDLRDGAGNRTAGTAVALFPAHTGAGGPGEIHLAFLHSGARMLEEAWPGLADLRQAVVLEWPHRAVHNRLAHHYGFFNRWEETSFVQVQGNLVFLDESRLVWSNPLQPEYLVSEMATARLMRRRPLRPEDAVRFQRFFRTLATQRLGLGPPGRAVVGPLRPGSENFIRIPPPDTPYHNYWRERFPAVLAALEARVGAEALRLAVDEFLAGSGAGAGAGTGPASFQEMLDLVARRSEDEASTRRLLQDLFVDGFLPEPVLDGVEFRAAAGGGWRVTGRMTNRGDGEALCRVVLTTDLGAVETVVRADKGESTPFALSSRHRPQAVLLDPDQQCHRLVRNGVPRDRVYFQGGQG